MTSSGKMPPEEADWSLIHSSFKVFLLLFILAVFLLCGGFLFQHLEQEVTLEHFYAANVEQEKHKADLLKGFSYPMIGVYSGILKEALESSGFLIRKMENGFVFTKERIMNFQESLWAHAIVLGEDDWTQIASERLEFYERQVSRLSGSNAARSDSLESPWSFMDSLFYTFTLVTTIGFGNISPRTGGGKLATIVYGLVGIPVVLTLLDEIGKLLSKAARRIFGIDDAKLSLALLLTVLSTGTLFFAFMEDLTWLDACYFSFVTFSSVGFGDIVPAKHRNFLFSILYIVSCLALLSVSLSFWKCYIDWTAESLLVKLLRKQPVRSSERQHAISDDRRNTNASRIPGYNQPPNLNSDMPYRRAGRKASDDDYGGLDSINEE